MGEIYTAGRSPAWQEWRQQFKGRDSITVDVRRFYWKCSKSPDLRHTHKKQ